MSSGEMTLGQASRLNKARQVFLIYILGSIMTKGRSCSFLILHAPSFAVEAVELSVEGLIQGIADAVNRI